MQKKTRFSPLFRAKKTYHAVYSLGTNCACADYLRRMGLRSAAGPFDWLLAEEAQWGLETLLGGFKGFFEKEDLFPLANIQNDIRRYYQNKRTGYLFLHDFNRAESFESQYPHVAEKYARRQERMLSDLNSSKPVLLVLYAENGVALSEDALIAWGRRLEETFGKNVDFWCIQYDPLQKEEYIKKNVSARVCLHSLGNVSAHPRIEGNLQWDASRVRPVFAGVRVRHSWRDLLAKLYPVVVRFRAWFIWNKPKRRAFVERNLGK